jgi:pimeloyl-ACP methyl ester carboxylesterase
VFVHGINSDENAFRSASAFWPDLLLDDLDFSNVGIFAFEYRSKISAPGYTLGDAVDYLKEILKLELIDQQRQIIFVCHSMGGNLVRRYLVMQSLHYAKMQTKIGLFMLACPSIGSHYANLFRLIRRNYHMQLESLVNSQRNVWLNDLDKDFRNLLSGNSFEIIGRELAEDLPIVGRWLMPRTQVVPPQSALRYFGDPLKVPGSDHFTISAPSGSDSLQHRVLKDWMKSNFVVTSDTQVDTPEAIATMFVEAVDVSDYQRAWDMLDELAQTTLVSGFDEFESLCHTRKELGAVLSRRLVGSSQLSDPPGFVKGTYKLLNFVAHFEKGGFRGETVSLRRAWAGGWKPFGYTIALSPMQNEIGTD